MKLENMTAEDLELLSLTDIAYKILHDGKKTINTPTIFHKICEMLGYGEEVYQNKISDFYTSLIMDKRFILLDNGEWDLSHNHSVNLIVDDDDDDDTSDIDEIDEENETDSDDTIDIDSEVNDDDSLDDNDDIDDLTILNEDEMEADE